MRDNSNSVSVGFAVAALIITILFALFYGWSGTLILGGIAILEIAPMVWLALRLFTREPVAEPAPLPREQPAPPKRVTPDSAVSTTQRLLDYAFPDDADARAVVERDLARAAGERGRRDYADLLRDRFRSPA
jgi:hypothetical protein